jgi:hypothetical protein
VAATFDRRGSDVIARRDRLHALTGDDTAKMGTDSRVLDDSSIRRLFAVSCITTMGSGTSKNTDSLPHWRMFFAIMAELE